MTGNIQSLREIEAFFHEQIPLTRAMGVRVEAWNEEQLVLTAPLEANHNHLGTAFGGSLSAIATLTGYGLLWLELGDRGAHVVIRDSAMSFRRPVRGVIRAVGRRPAAAEIAAFRDQFSRAGKARLRLNVVIEHRGQVAVEFNGTFVAMR